MAMVDNWSKMRAKGSGQVDRMFKKIGFAVIAAALMSGASWSQSLEDSLALTYTTNPTLQAERARVRAVGEGIAQARAGYLPSISASAGISQSHTESSGGFFSQSNSVTPKSYSLSASQAIWRGGRITGAIDQAQATFLAAEENLRAIEQSVLLEAATAYLDIQRDTQIAEIRRNNVDVLGAQLRAAEDRFEVGEITRTDVAQAEARQSAARAQFAAALAQLASSRAAYTRIVGQAPGTLADVPPLPELPATLEDAVEIASDFSPTLRGAAFSEEAARAGIQIARGTLLPEVSLSASAGSRFDQSLPGDQSDSYSVGAQVSIPIFTGGLNRSRLRAANHSADQARLQVSATRRLVEQNTTNAFNNLLATDSVIESSSQAVRANEIALDGVQQEAFVGLRTTLDVLNAEQELLDSRLTLVSAERDAYVAGLFLLQSMGLLTAETLGLDVETYDAEASTRSGNIDLTPWN
tara:strand:+ start:3596 stop:4999 length:1404 start_codon:yes stop_codon:yes gene_type:complete